ncbi:S8 family serine peptidase [Kibdelosporangium philippinense]|uniref:S8 family serine peptidase n=1 Tax=Kibdelosporangium philippinense TaxID=211113 RepID=A0ABS8Z8I3_9PSEU|nr:S8 family serine peptidase [Kibdelosporangium philippinense]MCE7004204.1 S8 family serine peptidase [Kibdelosporangium philippinense]
MIATFSSPPGHAAPARTQAEAIILLTGDRVFLSGQGTPRYLQPAPGRERHNFSVYQSKGHTYVVPADAMPLLAKGVLDERLFDVTELRLNGHVKGTVPVIVQYEAGRRPLTAQVTKLLPSIDAVALKTRGSDVWETAKSGSAKKVWLDATRKATLDQSVRQIGAPAAWQAAYTGKGIKVAVLDTGVDQTHPDLATQEIAEKNFSSSRDNVDRYGHGTHVASIVAGTGAKSGGKYRGVAPDAKILDVKVLGDNGSGTDSGIIAGMQWAAEQGADVINMSLGSFDGPEVDPLEEAVNTLSAKYGTLFVIAAGNFGPGDGTIDSPGSADAALTVGAVDRANKIADFSGRGPRDGGGMIKPDITAPGVDIMAALHAAGRIGEPIVDGYTALSGTSMAAPHVAGAAALLAQQHPSLSGSQLKARLVGSSTPTPGLTPFEQGAGRVDSAAALKQTVDARPTSASFGQHRWPHSNQPAVTKEITYTNDSSEPVTLDLTMETNAPANLFTISPAQLVVPARSKATAVAAADIRNVPDGGQFGGAIVATGGGQQVRTAIEVELEVESYDLTLNAIARSGEHADFASAYLINVDTGDRIFPEATVDGKLVQRLPRGRYILSGSVLGHDPYTHDVLNYPDLTITGPATIDLDARLTKPVSITLPTEKPVTLSLLQTGFERKTEKDSFKVSNLSLGGDIDHIGLAQLGPDSDEILGQLSTSWTVENDFYGLAWYTKGSFPSGITKEVQPSELATVKVDAGPLLPGQSALIGATSSPRDQGNWGLGALGTFAPPGIRTEYYGGENADWARRMTVSDSNGYQGGVDGPLRTYVPGKAYTESFYRGVFGPSFSDNRTDPWVQQRGDSLIAHVPLFGDGAGNAGFSTASEATTKLYRDGELMAESPDTGFVRMVVPRGSAKYQLTAEATRAGYSKSTHVAASWTFTSDHSSGITALPVSAIRYTPKLDASDKAKTGILFAVPIQAQPQAATTSKPRLTSTEVSYDRGATWQQAALFGDFLLLYHPPGAASVSFRASAADDAGNKVEQTIIDAYLLV